MSRTRFVVIGLVALAVAIVAVLGLRHQTPVPVVLPQLPPSNVPEPMRPAVPLSAAQDRQRLLGLLHLKTLRDGVTADSANYDEARANPFPALPDPLKLKDGRAVTTTDMWWRLRRQEIADDYEQQVYGQLQSFIIAPAWTTVATAPEAFGRNNGVTRYLNFHIAGTLVSAAVDIKMTITLPAAAKGPVPVILQLAPGDAKPAPESAASTWREQVLAKGWGFAVLDVTSIQPDDGADLTRGIIGLQARGKPRGLTDWGVLRVWAWGASRAMDYFEIDPTIDAAQVGIEGHSRYGKAALVAMAYDPRFVVAYISSSGAGGAALLRRNFGERLENLTGTGEYHWFAGNFLQYAGRKTAADLPVDAHELLALCAPRPVFIGAGADGDKWVDARGMFMAEVAAGPVYTLLGAKALSTSTMPAVGVAAMDGDLAFRQHDGGHTPDPNWPAFLTFASRYIHAGGKPTLPHKPAGSSGQL